MPCASQRDIYLENNQVYHVKTKNIDVRFHNIRELIPYGYILLKNVDTYDNATNVLTKQVISDKFRHCFDLLHVSQCYA